MVKHWTPLEFKTLRQLRDGFLAGTAGKSNYWISETQLELYDRTFAERIGWKWAGALSELGERGWRPQSHRIVDWACGTGIASRSDVQGISPNRLMARATSTVESVTGASAVRTTTLTNYAAVTGVSGKGIGIAVLDSGIAWQHASFKGDGG